MITAQDIARHRGRAARRSRRLPAPAAALSERLLLVVLYITVLASSVAIIEPSPHDGLMGVLAIACVAAGVRFDRHLALLFLLLLVFNVAGLLSLLNVPGQEMTVQFSITSIYLGVAAMLFAALFADNTMSRIVTVRAAYVLTATVIALAGIAGYFNLFPHAHDLFATNDRALGAFKDPERLRPVPDLAGAGGAGAHAGAPFRLTDVFIVGVLLFALLLSFSRGAWFHFAVSCAVMMMIAFITADTDRERVRIIALGAIAIAAVAGFIVIALSFDSVATCSEQRAQLIQSYDVGSGGRFRLQELALAELLNYPNGMGPFGFASVHGNNSITSTCRPSWSTAGPAPWPTSCCWAPHSGRPCAPSSCARRGSLISTAHSPRSSAKCLKVS